MKTSKPTEILLLDPVDGRRLARMNRLNTAGFTVLQAASAIDALDLLTKTDPEALVIAEEILPGFQSESIEWGKIPPIYLIGLPPQGARIPGLAAVIPDGRLDLLDSVLEGLQQRIQLRAQRQDLERGLAELAHLAIDLGRGARSIPDDALLRQSLEQVLAMAQARFNTKNQSISGLLFARQPGTPMSLRATQGVEDSDQADSKYKVLAGEAVRQNRVLHGEEGAIAVPLPTLQFQNGALILLGLGNADISSFQRILMTAAAEVSLARDANTLYHLAMMDGLTAIYNHGYGQEQVVKELRRVSRSHLSITLAIIDLDHFKEINDRHGHIAGDHCLRSAASALKDALRSTDILYRSGGEEFAAVLPGAGPLQTELIGSKLCDALRQLNLEWDGMPIPITASVGLASLPESALAGRFTAGTGWTNLAHRLLELADDAMYQAKAQGRDGYARMADTGDVSNHPKIVALLQSMT